MRRPRWIAVLLVSFSLVITGCGVASVSEPRAVAAGGNNVLTDPQDGSIEATAIPDSVFVYFLRNGRVMPVYRSITLPSDATTIDAIDSALRELRKGPNAKELAVGYTSAFPTINPEGSAQIGISRIERGEAIVGLGFSSFGQLPNDKSVQALAQLVFTVVNARPGVGGVRLNFVDATTNTFITNIPTEEGFTQGTLFPEEFRCLGIGLCPETPDLVSE